MQILSNIADYGALINQELIKFIDNPNDELEIQKKVDEIRYKVDEVNYPVNSFSDFSYGVEEREFKDKISLITTNMHRRFDRIVRQYIWKCMNDVFNQLKNFMNEIKRFRKIKTNSLNELHDLIHNKIKELDELKRKLYQTTNKLKDSTYGVKSAEFSSEIEKIFERTLKKINKKLR